MTCRLPASRRFLKLNLVTLVLVALIHPMVRAEQSADKRAAEAYQKAYELILSKDYAKAYRQFGRFVKKYDDSSYYDDARYWYCYAFMKSKNDLERSFECYLEFIEESPDSEWREQAEENAALLAKRLSKTDPKYQRYLAKLTEDESDDLTHAIILALLERGDEETIIEMFDEITDTDQRRQLVHALGSCETPECIQKLMEIVRTDPDVDVRRHAMFSLAEMGDEEEVIPLMLDILKTETDTDIRRHAVWLIADSQDPMVAETLVDIALNEKDVDMARAATYGLANVDDPLVTEALQRLVRESKDIDIKRAALYALIERDDAATLDTLKEIALSDSDTDLRRAATYAIAEMHDEPAAAAVLIEIFKASEDRELRRAALYGLLNFEEEISIELLKEAALATDDEDLARAAMYALADVMDEENVAFVGEVYEKTPFHEVRRAAIHVMLDVGGDSAIPVLARALKTEPDPDLRATMVWALQDADDDDDEVVAILIDVAKNDTSTNVRRAAIQLLGQMDSDEAHDALLDILKERSRKKSKD